MKENGKISTLISEFYDNNADDIIKRIDLIDEKMDAINQELGLGQDLDLRNQ